MLAILEKYWRRLGIEGRDFLELVLLPSLAIIMPWRVCFALFRWLSGWKYLYHEAADQSYREALARGWVTYDAELWQRRRRLVTLIDHADFFLARFNTDRWLLRHVEVTGAWPPPQTAFVGCTFHWGAGMWGARHIRASGLSAHTLIGAFDPNFFSGRSVRGWYAWQRIQELGNALNSQVLDVSKSLRPAIRALRNGEQVMAAIDIPADQVAASEVITFLDTRARVPRGFLRLAVDLKIPVVVFLTGIRMSDGKRFLRIYQLPLTDNLGELIAKVFTYLEDAIREEPAAWHFWSEADRFFVPEKTASALQPSLDTSLQAQRDAS